MNPISPIRHVIDTIKAPALDAIKGAGEAQAATSGDFGSYLKASINSVEAVGQAASQSTERFLNGEGEELHQVALAMQKAELSFDLFMQVRNKVVSAYQEVMRMQL
ncbi:MAG: flagellar hook-basal body complex protein FliE [Acidobacteria bacterium]|nr:flagellar hook-basal body complex protein FliE [Acidobacteriota bacterium]